MRTVHAESARSKRVAWSRLRATWMRCPRLPAVSTGMEKSRVNKYGLGMPGAILRVGLRRAPAVMRPASLPAIRARAESSIGLKYKAASDNVCKSQVAGGQGDTERPRFC